MATATKETKVTITLVLSEAEAFLIRNITREPIVVDGMSETTNECKCRESIFNAVDTGLKKRK